MTSKVWFRTLGPRIQSHECDWSVSLLIVVTPFCDLRFASDHEPLMDDEADRVLFSEDSSFVNYVKQQPYLWKLLS